jgi:hypothetical protein
MARKNVYDRLMVDEMIMALDNTGYTDQQISWFTIQNDINTLISRGCEQESIFLNVNASATLDYSTVEIVWMGERPETDEEYKNRIEAFERRSAIAKQSAQKRSKREIQKAKDEFAAASKIIEKLKEKFGEDTLTD